LTERAVSALARRLDPLRVIFLSGDAGAAKEERQAGDEPRPGIEVLLSIAAARRAATSSASRLERTASASATSGQPFGAHRTTALLGVAAAIARGQWRLPELSSASWSIMAQRSSLSFAASSKPAPIPTWASINTSLSVLDLNRLRNDGLRTPLGRWPFHERQVDFGSKGGGAGGARVPCWCFAAD
jgi:hypothetical protein